MPPPRTGDSENRDPIPRFTGIFNRLLRNAPHPQIESFREGLETQAKINHAAHRIRAKRFRLMAPFFEYVSQFETAAWSSRRHFFDSSKNEDTNTNLTKILRGLDEDTGLTSLDRGETHAVFTPILAAALTHSGLQPNFMEMFSRVSHNLSSDTEKQIESGNNYFPLIQIGLGVQGSIFASELLALSPSLMQRSLGVDGNPGFGGQFLMNYSSGTFAMNTENVATGNERDKNYLGHNAVLQLSDVGTRYYETNAAIGGVSAVNGYMSGINPLFEHSLVSVRENPAWKQRSSSTNMDIHRARYIIELRKKDGKLCTLFTDMIVLATGIGKPSFRFDTNDPHTKSALENRERDLEKKELPLIVSAEEFNAYFSNPADPFSREKLRGKKIGVLGGGTSAVTAIESCFRLNSGYLGASVVRAGNPENVTWWHKTKITRKSFRDTLWARYFDLIDFLPENGEDDSVITTKEGYIKKLQEVVDPQTQKRKIVVTASDGQQDEYDMVIAATGYSQDIESIFQGLLVDETSQEPTPLHDVLEPIPLDSNPDLFAGKRMRDHAIFLAGPAALTSPDDPTSYPIKQAIPSFSEGSLQMAGVVKDLFEEVNPDALLENRTEEFFFLTCREEQFRDHWNENLNIRASLMIAITEYLNNIRFQCHSGVVFEIQVTEIDREAKMKERMPDDYQRTYHQRIRASENSEKQNSPVPINRADAEVLHHMLLNPPILEYVYALLRIEKIDPSLKITLRIANGGIHTNSISISQ